MLLKNVVILEAEEMVQYLRILEDPGLTPSTHMAAHNHL